MFKNWLDKVSNFIDEQKNNNTTPAIIPSNKYSIFDSKVQNLKITTESNIISRTFVGLSQLSGKEQMSESFILNQSQIKLLDMKLYRNLNKECPEIENENDDKSSNIHIDWKEFSKLRYFMQKPTTDILPIPFSESELIFFERENTVNINGYLFQKYRGLIKNGGIFENIYYMESQIDQIKKYFEDQLMQDSSKKMLVLEKSYQKNLEIYDNSIEVLAKVRKLRYCLMELKKYQLSILKIQKNFRKRAKCQEIISKMQDYKARVKPIFTLLSENYMLESAGKNYEALLSSKIFCEQQIYSKTSAKTKIFIDIPLKIDQKIDFWKNKLKQHLILQIRFKKTNQQEFKIETLETIIFQMLLMEKAIHSFSKLKPIEIIAINGYIITDKDIYKRVVFELESQSGWIDEGIKELLSKSHQKMLKKIKI